jgi:hypothetical protein
MTVTPAPELGRATRAGSDAPPAPELEKSGAPGWRASAGRDAASRPESGACGETGLEKSGAPDPGASIRCDGACRVPVATLEPGDACSQCTFARCGRVTGAESDGPRVTAPPAPELGCTTGAASDGPGVAAMPAPELEKSGAPGRRVSAGRDTATWPGSDASGGLELEVSGAPSRRVFARRGGAVT